MLKVSLQVDVATCLSVTTTATCFISTTEEKKNGDKIEVKRDVQLPIQASRGLIQAYKSIEWICVHHPIRREMRQRTRIGKLG